MNVLALDPGSSTGYSIFSIDGKIATLIAYGTIEPDITTSLYQGDHMLSLQSKVKGLIDQYDIKELALENYFASGRFAQGTDINYFFRGAIMMLARQLDMHYEYLNISNWKIHVALRTTATKEMKLKYGKQLAKKILIVDALWKRFGIRFPNHSISPKTGKPVIFKYDTSDAVAQGIYFCSLRFQCSEFKSNVAIPQDVEFKKDNKKVYIYQ